MNCALCGEEIYWCLAKHNDGDGARYHHLNRIDLHEPTPA